MHDRRRRRVLAAAAALLATLPVTAATPALAADVPPQEPGVTLRVFDVQMALDRICTLKSGQTPNVDRLLSKIDITDFGIENNFVSQVLGNITVPTTGTYTFRLLSDDGSRLAIDGTEVIDHDGLHPVEPKDGSTTLTAGLHALRIDHFEAGGGQQVTLQWKPPGAGSFSTVPNSVLSTDAGVVRVTAPGRKECEGIADSPGDGIPLAEVNPGWTLTNLRPAGFEPQVTGMDFFPDGRLALSTWGGTDNVLGEVWILDNVTGATDPSRVTRRKVADQLKEPMGLKIVDGKLYVSEKQQLTELNDTNGDGFLDQHRAIATWPFSNNFHQFAFGLLYRDGYFYLNLSVSINLGGATTDPQPAPDRGTTIQVSRSTGEVTYLAGGLRTPHGINWGPDGDLWVTDNQGGWLPSSKLLHVRPGRFFNHYMNPPGPFDRSTVTPPALWMPQNEIANSPSTPVLLDSGPFAGQMLIADVTYGGIQRAYLEKVDGEYQGALFRMTQGLEAGVTEMIQGPDGAIYTGGLGADGNWGQEGKLKFGLQKLTPNGTDVFDIKAMRATPTGFELEYTQPLGDETVARLAEAYTVKQWRYEPTKEYGGPKIDEQGLVVTATALSADRKTVTLTIDGLQPNRVVYVRSPRPFAAASGQTLWSTEAWYTLNAIPGAPPATNLALGRPATGDSSCNADEGAAKAVNGSITGGNSDKWCSLSNDRWLRVDLGSTRTVSRFVVRHAGAGGEPIAWNTRDFRIDVSTDGQSWTTVSTTTGNTATTTTHDLAAPVPARFARLRVDVPTNNGDPAARIYEFEAHGTGGGDRVTLFDGTDLSQWHHDGAPASWPVADGSAEVLGGDLRSTQSFGDFRLHVEFRIPNLPPEVTGQARGNSGVYLQDRYELQVLDSFGDSTLASNECGAVYDKRAPDSNPATAPDTWQTYDVTFRAARYDGATKVADARVTVVWNGVVVHDDVEIDGPTGAGAPESPAVGPIRLQDHGDPGANVRYRNIWVEPLV